MKHLPINIAAVCLVGLFLGGVSTYAQNVEKKDTLHRELVLEKDFIPSVEKVRKSYFNPLDNRSAVSLTPLSFVRNDYQVAMNVYPRLFAPLYIDHAPDFSPQVWYLRAYGGYPGYAGASTGWHIQATEQGVLDLFIDHKTETVRLRDGAIGIDKHLKNHDTEATAKYTHRLEQGLLHVTAQGYYDLSSVYGHLPISIKSEDREAPKYPLMAIRGGRLELEKTKAPLDFASPWSYDARLGVSYGVKDDLPYKPEDAKNPYPDESTLALDKPTQTSQLFFRAQGHLSYDLGDRWGALLGLHGSYALMPSLTAFRGTGPFVLGANPRLTSNLETFSGHLGANVQFLNRGSRNLVISPDVYLRWHAHPLFSLYVKVDGGASMREMREVYKTNRYFQATSLYDAVDISRLRAVVGGEVGNLQGFSFGVKGGWQKLDLFSDWRTIRFASEMEGESFPMLYFALRPREDVTRTFLQVHSDFVSPYGFKIGGELNLNRYKPSASSESAVQEDIMGLPQIEWRVLSSYRLTSALLLSADFSGLGGVVFSLANGEKVNANWITDLNLGADYRISNKFSVSLQALNLFGRSNARWLYYDRPGMGVIGAISFHL